MVSDPGEWLWWNYRWYLGGKGGLITIDDIPLLWSRQFRTPKGVRHPAKRPPACFCSARPAQSLHTNRTGDLSLAPTGIILWPGAALLEQWDSNPVQTGMVSDPGEWLWSSYRWYLGGEAAL